MEDLYYIPNYTDSAYMEDWLYKQMPYFIEKNNIVIEKGQANKINKLLAKYVYTLIFNICGLAATLVRTYTPTKLIVKPKHLKYSLEYVKNKCYPELMKKQSGGSYVIDSEYFGKNSGNYTLDKGTDLLDVKFGSNGVIRPAIDMSGGSKIISHEIDIEDIINTILANSEKKNLFPDNEIINILDNLGMTITNNSLKVLKRILRMHVNCLFLDLYKASPINVKKLENILSLRRHSVFM